LTNTCCRTPADEHLLPRICLVCASCAPATTSCLPSDCFRMEPCVRAWAFGLQGRLDDVLVLSWSVSHALASFSHTCDPHTRGGYDSQTEIGHGATVRKLWCALSRAAHLRSVLWLAFNLVAVTLALRAHRRNRVALR
jgi:hypothetical protein